MMRPFIALLFIGLVSPALGQHLDPALEGEGRQVQNLEIAKGAVSVSVESAGSLSLGGGDASGSGALGISLNDLTIGIGGTVPGDKPVANAGGVGGAGKAATPAVAEAAGVTGAGDCFRALPDRGALDQAIEEQHRLLLRESGCAAPTPGLAELLASYPALSGPLGDADMPLERLVAITISDGFVIVDYARAP